MISRRVLSAAWALLVLAFLLTVSEGQISITTYRTISQGWTNGGTGYMRLPIKNTSSGAMEVQIHNGTSWGYSRDYIAAGTGGGSTWSIRVDSVPSPAPGATQYINLDLLKSAPASDPDPVNFSVTMNYSLSLRTWNGSAYSYRTVPLSWVMGVVTNYDASQSLTPSPYSFPLVLLSGETPPSQVVLTGWTGSPGVATLGGTGVSGLTGHIAAGSDTHIDDINSDAVPDGAVITVSFGGNIIGTGTVSKLPAGNFNLYISLAPPAATGRVRASVAEGKDWGKSVALFLPRDGAPPVSVGNYGLTRASPIDWSTEEAAIYAGHGFVELRTIDGGQIVARAPMVKDADGNFDIVMTAGGDNEDKDDIGRWELNVTAFREDPRTVELQVFNGSTWSTIRTQVVLGSKDGAVRVITHELDNSSGQWSGRQYRWVLEGAVMASGTTPVVPFAFHEQADRPYGFTMLNAGQIGYTQEEIDEAELAEQGKDTDGDGVPDMEDFPEEPPAGTPGDPDADGSPDGRQETAAGMTRGEAHDDIASGVAKAIDRGGPGPGDTIPKMPGNADIAAQMSRAREMGEGATSLESFLTKVSTTGFLAAAGGLQIPLSSQTLVMTIPTVPNPVTLNLTPWASTISAIRAILASVVSWFAALYCLKVVRSAFT